MNSERANDQGWWIRAWMATVVLGLMVWGTSLEAQTVIYTYDNSTSGNIPFTSGVNGDPANDCPAGPNLTRTFSVTDSFTLAGVGFGLNVSHIFREDVVAVLESPAGTRAVLLNITVSDPDDNFDILMSSNSESTSLDDGDGDNVGVPFYHREIDVNSLGAFAGEGSAGTWTLYLCDDFAADTGTFNNARLILQQATSQAAVCSSTETYEWGDNGNQVDFSSTTFGDITLTEVSTFDLDNTSIATTDFVTRTTIQGGHTGYYSMGFDADATGIAPDTNGDESSAMIVVFSFSPPVRDLSFDLLDVDFITGSNTSDGGFEDLVRVLAEDESGNRLPYQTQDFDGNGDPDLVGDVWEADITSGTGATTSNVSYFIAGPVAQVTVEYFQGDFPNDPGDQFIGITDFTLCAWDFGDAPTTYGTGLGTGARHALGDRSLFLGSTPPDGEGDGQPVAGGADNNGANGDGTEEDGVASFPAASTVDGIYTVTVTVTNGSGSAADLCGWIDFDQGGAFESDEGICVVVPASGSNADCTDTGGGVYSCTLTWTVPVADRSNSGDFYSRFRVTTDGLTASEATGSKADGEVEDYRASIANLPVTLASFESQELGGSLDVRFTTLSETRNAGFEVQGRSSGGEWRVLARIPARGADSLVPRSYQRRLAATVGGQTLDELRLVDVDYQGRRRPHGPFVPGQAYGGAPSARAVDWRLVKARTGARGPLEIVAGEEAPKPVSGSLADDLAARLLVAEKGLHRVTYEQLAAAGVDLAGQPSTALAVLNGGRAQPRHVGCGIAFGPGCFVEFLGRPKLTLHSPVDVYTLRVDAAQALPIASSMADAGKAPVGFQKRKELRYDNRLYSFGSPNGDPWFEERLLSFGSPAATQRSFDLPDRGDGAVKLVVDLWGVTELPGDAPDHHAVVRLNGTEVGDLRFDGLTPQRLKVDVTPWVRATDNQLSIQVPGDTGYDFDLVHVEGFKVVYRGDTVAESGRWSGRTFGADPFAVTGLTAAPAVLWASTTQGWQRLEGMPVAGSEGLQLDSPWGAAKSWLAQEGSFLVPGIEAGLPVPAEPSPADYLIIAHPAFAGELDDLVALQARRGLTTDVVTTEAVYAAYSDHAADPQAIRQLVVDSWERGGLRYVLLVGGDSYDPYDYLGLGSVSFVPTPYVPVGELVSFAPADDRLADVDGDTVPDLPLGRLPVRTPEELEAMVDKLWAWELRNASREALLASGRSDAGDQLTSVSAAFQASLGAAWAADAAAVDHLGSEAARGLVLDALHQGAPLVSYVGHSSYGQWDFDPLLNLPDVAVLGNAGKPSWVLQWGCWNSYFVSPEVVTLSDALLLDHRGGAAGTIGATTLVASASHQALGRRVFAQLGGGAATFGEALLGAKRDLAAGGSGADAIAGVALLGDPASPVPNLGAPGSGPEL